MIVGEVERRDARIGSKFAQGDTLLARITPCLENGKTGFVDFLQESETGVGSTEFVVMRGRSVPPTFVQLFARSEETSRLRHQEHERRYGTAKSSA